MSQISFQNSITTRTLTSPYTFEGEYVDIVPFSEIDILYQGVLSIASNVVITAFLSNDRVN